MPWTSADRKDGIGIFSSAAIDRLKPLLTDGIGFQEAFRFDNNNVKPGLWIRRI